MSGDGIDLEAVRLRLIELLQADEYRITEVARTTGRRWFASRVDFPTEYNLINHVLQLLEDTTDPLRQVLMGDPPGSGGLAYRIVDPLDRDLYVKVKIEEETCWLLSFKRSDHA
jgi:hypothetical protein